ncbi:MAG: hypothetical protein AAFR02_06400, partial [Pseudomonadota bacterium]
CGQPSRYLVFDPKGELATVVGQGLVHQGAHFYTINPFGVNNLPNHKVSLLEYLHKRCVLASRVQTSFSRSLRNSGLSPLFAH